MKSSTVRRSALSKESMDVIENLSGQEPNYLYNNSSYENNYDSQSYENLPEEYVRSEDESINKSSNKSMSKEIDLLWQNFKNQQLNSKSPLLYFTCGFLAGIIATIAVFMLLGLTTFNHTKDSNIESTQSSIESQIPGDEEYSDTQTEQEQDSITENETNESETSDKVESTKTTYRGKTKKYVIKDGDTVERIIKKEYGSYTPERAEAIMKANNLSNLDHISIDQELLLPVEE